MVLSLLVVSPGRLSEVPSRRPPGCLLTRYTIARTLMQQTTTGKNNYTVCDGYCKHIETETASTFYKNVKPLVPYLHPNRNHNVNFLHDDAGVSTVVTSFLDEILE